MRPVSRALLTLSLCAPSSAAAAPAGTVQLCHVAGGGTVRIDVNGNALQAHLAHGDAVAGAFFPDVDGDGFGDGNVAPASCPAAGLVSNAEDCDDSDAFAYPGAPETCNDIDDDCDGVPDDGVATSIGFGTGEEVPAFERTGANAGASAYAIRATGGADFDGDGLDDFVVGTYSSGIVDVWYGTLGGVSSTPALTIRGDSSVRHFGQDITTGDFDGDGYDDLLVGAADQGHAVGGAAQVFFGSSTGLESSPGWTVRSTDRSEEFGVAVGAADVDGDGAADVVVMSKNRLCVYPGVLAAVPASAGMCRSSGSSGSNSYTTVGDFNGDDLDDVAYFFYPAGTYVALGSVSGLGTGTLVAPGRFPGENASRATDYTGDGYDDLIVAGYYPGAASLYAGGAGGVATTSTWTGGTTFDLAHPGDLNGDGKDDLAVADPAGFRVYFGTGTGLATAPVGIGAGYAAVMVAAAGDVDGDGAPDVLSGDYRYNGGSGRVFLWRGGGGTCVAAGD